MDPITRKETFLAKAVGQDVTTPTPVTREEYFLNQIAKGGGSGGGVLVVHDVDGTLDKTWQEIADAIENEIPAYLFGIDKNEGVVVNAYVALITSIFIDAEKYFVASGEEGTVNYKIYGATTPDGYPAEG